MIQFISVLLFAVFLFLSSLHIYWGFGGKWGGSAVLPAKDDGQHVMMPGLLPCLIVAIGLAAVGLLVLINTGMIAFALPSWLQQYGLWIICGIFTLRAIGDFRYVGFFKQIKHTTFGKNDTRYYSPLCLAIGLLTALLEMLR